MDMFLIERELGKLEHSVSTKLSFKERYSELVSSLSKLDEDLPRLESLYKAYDILLKTSTLEKADFQNRRLSFLEGELSYAIDQVFPNNNLEPKLNVNTRYNKNYLELSIMSGTVDRDPYVSEGGLFRQVLGAISSLTLTEASGSMLALLDEPFSEASESPEKLSQLASVLSYFMGRGFQSIMIEHKSEIFANIDHVCFSLENVHNTVNVLREEVLYDTQNV